MVSVERKRRDEIQIDLVYDNAATGCLRRRLDQGTHHIKVIWISLAHS
jgi:hypothetical protein